MRACRGSASTMICRALGPDKRRVGARADAWCGAEMRCWDGEGRRDVFLVVSMRGV